MNHDKETLEAADDYVKPGMMRPNDSVRSKERRAFLAGVKWREENPKPYPGKAEGLDNVNNKDKGLFEKYHVERVDGKPMPAGCIVLEWKDPNAWPGIAAFSRAVRLAGYLQLSDDLDKNLEARGYCTREKHGEEIAKLKEQLKIAKGALERLEAGFAGMFGHQSVSPQQDFYDRGEKFVMDALKQLRDLEE